jgi:hypothetical protein
MASRATAADRSWPAGITMAPPGITPPQAEAGAGSGGPRPHAGLQAWRLLRHGTGGDLPSP